LRKLPLELTEIDYAKTGLDAATVADIVARAGGVAAVLNTRHATAKANGWVAKPPPTAEFARAVVKDVNLMRRPIVVAGDQLIVGFDRAAYSRLAGPTR
jgi:arsenate reductase-like glutaredoxin family protein